MIPDIDISRSANVAAKKSYIAAFSSRPIALKRRLSQSGGKFSGAKTGLLTISTSVSLAETLVKNTETRSPQLHNVTPCDRSISYAKMPVMTPNANTPNVMLVTPMKVYFMSKVAARATVTLVMACSIDTRSKA